MDSIHSFLFSDNLKTIPNSVAHISVNSLFPQRLKNIIRQLNNEPDFDFEKTIQILRKELGFIRDGHFSIGESEKTSAEYEYAIQYSFYKGMPVIDCKKFYYDNESEKQQLEAFANKGAEYKNDEPLILDFRGNRGGSTNFIYDFLLGSHVQFQTFLPQNSHTFHMISL